MTKEQLIKNADACANQIVKVRAENESYEQKVRDNDAIIAALVDKEQQLRKEAAAIKSPEAIFLEIIDGLTIRVDKDKYPDSIFLFKGDEWVFEIEKSTVWCRQDKAWNRISESIQGDYSATQAFLKIPLEQHFKMKDVTPTVERRFSQYGLEQHFKMKGVTPDKQLL